MNYMDMNTLVLGIEESNLECLNKIAQTNKPTSYQNLVLLAIYHLYLFWDHLLRKWFLLSLSQFIQKIICVFGGEK